MSVTARNKFLRYASVKLNPNTNIRTKIKLKY